MSRRTVRNGVSLNFIRVFVFTAMIGIMIASCSTKSFDGKIVAVEVMGELNGSFKGSRLIVIDPARTDKPAIVLTDDFESACFPALSHDGRYLFFQGKTSWSDPWQIWVVDLHRNTTKRVTNLPDDCTHPASLPDGRVIFSREGSVKKTAISSLFRCKMDGSELEQVTFNPGQNLFSSVLGEGRVLYLSNQQYPEPTPPQLMIMLPDGTKSELYHQGDKGNDPVTGGVESGDGHIYFITKGGNLTRVLHHRPLHTFENLSTGLSGRFSAVYPYAGSSCLVSYQPADEEFYGIYIFDLLSEGTPVQLYSGEGNLTQPLWIRALEERPRILPSAVNTEKQTGLLMSQDINHSMMPVRSPLSGDTLASKIIVYGLDGLMGATEVEKDGSFYLEIDSDTPFRIETINTQSETVRGPSDWIYLRPSERRACVGCHADQELAPKNFQPLAVKGPPVLISAKKKEISNSEKVTL